MRRRTWLFSIAACHLSLTVYVGCASDAEDIPLGDAGSNGEASSDGAISRDASADVRPNSDAIADGGAADATFDGSSSDGAVCVVEECLDGLDNDCSGAADCADPSCGAKTECVDVADAGVFAMGTVVGTGEGCPDGYDDAGVDLGRDPIVDASCGGCGCSARTSCSASIADMFGSCPTDSIIKTFRIGSSCTDLPSGAIIGSARVGFASATSSCTTSGTPTTIPAQWNESVRFCRARVGAGCPGGSACLQRQGPERRCVLAAGTTDCPPGYSLSTGDAGDAGTWYAGFDDTRTCGPYCTCKESTPGSCSGARVYVFSKDLCLGTMKELEAGTDFCGAVTIESAQVAGGTSGSCAVTNTLTGTATPSKPHTVCCR